MDKIEINLSVSLVTINRNNVQKYSRGISGPNSFSGLPKNKEDMTERM